MLLADLLYADLSIDVDSVPLISDLLRAFVGYCHELRSVPASLTDETMAAVAQWTAELQQEIHDRSEWQWSWSASALAELASATGSVGALRRLEMDRLPDEPFRWASVPGDAVDAIEPVLELTDRACEHFFDIELRTATRRLIARLAASEPSVFTRRSRRENTAAAIVWAAATANHAFTDHGVLVKDLVAHLGASGTPSQRAETFLRAIPGARRSYEVVGLGSSDMLTSSGRAAAIARRDHLLSVLALEVELGPDEVWRHDRADPVSIRDPDALWEIVEQHAVVDAGW